MFRFIGIAVSVIVGGFFLLAVIGSMMQEQHRNEVLTTISGPTTNPSGVDFAALMSEQPVSSTVTPSEDVQGYQQFCTNQWTKRGQLNAEMYDYCLKNQHDGYDKLVNLMQEFGGYSWMSNLVAGAIQKWTKQGSRQDEMVAYEVDQQIDSFKDLKYQSVHEPGIKIGVANDCLQQWTKEYIQWEMVKYCYKQTLGLN